MLQKRQVLSAESLGQMVPFVVLKDLIKSMMVVIYYILYHYTLALKVARSQSIVVVVSLSRET